MTADVEPLLDDGSTEDKSLRERVITQHIRLLELAGRKPVPHLYDTHIGLSFFIAQNVGLTLDQKQEVLEMDSESARLQFLAEYLTRFIPSVEQAEEMHQKVRSNGHFRDFPPPHADPEGM